MDFTDVTEEHSLTNYQDITCKLLLLLDSLLIFHVLYFLQILHKTVKLCDKYNRFWDELTSALFYMYKRALLNANE